MNHHFFKKPVMSTVDVNGIYGASYSPPAEHLLRGLLGRGTLSPYNHVGSLPQSQSVFRNIEHLGLGLPFNHAAVLNTIGKHRCFLKHVATLYSALPELKLQY